MADDPVVIIKSQPMKSGNRMEDKTEMTVIRYNGTTGRQNLHVCCEGVKLIKKY